MEDSFVIYLGKQPRYGAGLVAHENEDIGHGLVVHALELLEQYG